MSKFNNGGFGKVGESGTKKSAQSKKCRLLKGVESGEIGLVNARKIWESDNGLRCVCEWSEVLDRKEGRSVGRVNGDKRLKVIKWEGGDDWRKVAKLKVEIKEEEEDDEEVMELMREVEELERKEREEEERVERAAGKLMERERKLSELRERVARFNRTGEE